MNRFLAMLVLVLKFGPAIYKIAAAFFEWLWRRSDFDDGHWPPDEDNWPC